MYTNLFYIINFVVMLKKSAHEMNHGRFSKSV